MKLPAYSDFRPLESKGLDHLPKHWDVIRGRFVMDVNPPAPQLRRLKPEDEVSFIPMEALGEFGGLNLEQTKVVGDVSGGYTEFQDGDVVFAKITPCFENGKATLASGLMNGVAYGTTELHVLRAKPILDSSFLFYVTLSDRFRKLGESEMYGAGGQKRVPPEFNKDFPMPMPSLEEQQQIAAFLDWKTEQIDTLIARKQELLEKLKEKRLAIITQAVTRGLNLAAPLRDSGIPWLGQVPEHWEVLRIATCSTKLTNGYVGPTRDILTDEGIRYLQSLHIKNNAIVINRPFFVSEEWSLEHSRSILKEGDVLIVQTGDIGQVAVVTKEFEGCNCHALIIVEPEKGRLHGPFLSWFLNSSIGVQTLKSIQTGALHPHLNCTVVHDVRVAIPPFDEQVEVASYLDAKLAQIAGLISKVETAIDRLNEYRSALITAATTGKIDVRKVKVPNPKQP